MIIIMNGDIWEFLSNLYSFQYMYMSTIIMSDEQALLFTLLVSGVDHDSNLSHSTQWIK